MKIKEVNQLAEIISKVQHPQERNKLIHAIGNLCMVGRETTFSWYTWNQACEPKDDR